MFKTVGYRVEWRATAARIAAAGACLALAGTTLILLTGGFRVTLGPFRMSSHAWWRPSVAAAVLYVTALALADRQDRSRPWRSWLNALEKQSFTVAMTAAAAVLWFGMQYTAKTAGGADSLGYVSQAYLWPGGNVLRTQTQLQDAPWPLAAESLAPLSYRAGPTPHTIVPVYSAGLPIIMAASVLLCGPCGPFYVGPVFAALLVVLTWALSKRITESGLTSALAAILMASSPAFLFNLVAPMSDVVGAALWTAALALLAWPRTWQASLGGALAGAAIVVRPNLVPLALAGVLAAELWTDGGRLGRRALAFLVALAPGVIFVALLNEHLYGSPLRSGYPRFTYLYRTSYFFGNAWRYASWLIESQGVVVLAALLPLIVTPARPTWLTLRRALPIVAFVGILCASYFFYLEFGAWWYLRFFLPGFPLLFVLLAASLAWLVRLLPAPAMLSALTVMVVLLVEQSLGFVAAKGLTQIGAGEQRYAAIAQYVDQHLPPNAIVIGLQHTGTIAFYAGRPTLRYGDLPPQGLRSVIDWLHANGYRPYVVLEEWEEREYRKHFAPGRDSVSRLEIPVLAETTPDIPVRLYDPFGSVNTTVRRAVIPIAEAPKCGRPAATWIR